MAVWLRGGVALISALLLISCGRSETERENSRADIERAGVPAPSDQGPSTDGASLVFRSFIARSMDGSRPPQDIRSYTEPGPIGYYFVYSDAVDETLRVELRTNGVAVNQCDPEILRGNNGYFCQFDYVPAGNHEIAAYIDGARAQLLSFTILERSSGLGAGQGQSASAATFDVLSSIPWRRRPTQREIERAFPARALERGISGEVLLRCQILRGGSVECLVLREQPAEMGFGVAALRLSRTFRMETRLADDTDVVGRTVEIPVRFQAS